MFYRLKTLNIGNFKLYLESVPSNSNYREVGPFKLSLSIGSRSTVNMQLWLSTIIILISFSLPLFSFPFSQEYNSQEYCIKKEKTPCEHSIIFSII